MADLAWLADYDSAWTVSLLSAWREFPGDLQWLRREPGYDKSIERQWASSRVSFIDKGLRRLSRDFTRLARIQQTRLATRQGPDNSSALLQISKAVFTFRAQSMSLRLLIRLSPCTRRVDMERLFQQFSALYVELAPVSAAA